MRTTRLVLSLAAALALALPSQASSQTIEPLAPAGAPANAFPAPDRPVADIISPIWHNERDRDKTDEAGQVIRLLGLKPGMSVADIGAGSGYYTLRLSRALGPDGRVFAQDVTPDYLARLTQRVRDERLSNVSVGLGEPHDPRLPANSLDAAVLIHMYHEIAQPFALMANLIPALKPGARVGIVDLDAPTAQHGTPPALLRCELAAIGFREVSFTQLKGDSGYLAVFAPPLESERVTPAAVKACAAPRR